MVQQTYSLSSLLEIYLIDTNSLELKFNLVPSIVHIVNLNLKRLREFDKVGLVTTIARTY